MNIQILPNWFKKIAIISFFVFSFLQSLDAFIDGWNNGYNYNTENTTIEYSTYYQNIFGKQTIKIFSIVSYLSMIAYFLSKEKLEDDYINLLRLQSFQLSFILIVSISFAFYLFESNIFKNVDDGFSLFLILYLIIFAIKKRIDL